jgi:hypothetical protein
VPCLKQKNHRSNLWFVATDLSLSPPAKLAAGLGLKDVLHALERDAPRVWFLRSPAPFTGDSADKDELDCLKLYTTLS